jgi:hypothetical protein
MVSFSYDFGHVCLHVFSLGLFALVRCLLAFFVFILFANGFLFCVLAFLFPFLTRMNHVAGK